MKTVLMRPLLAAAAFSLAACSQPAPAAMSKLDGDWTVDGAASRFSFVTVKSGTLAEAHTFNGLSGRVTANGDAEIDIPLATVETNIDIRNERMREFLFETGTYPEAKVAAKLDPAVFTDLSVGDAVNVPVTATLNLHGETQEIDTDLLVTRIGADKVQVGTPVPIIVNAADFGLDAGVEKLRELANLPGITPDVPVTFSIVFTR
ncbi:YceI family protein [Hyphomonas sp.]|uniref:YceI family protein n=1 Tax=Hyphomonas sp. TaxID=87 RepID=UPI003529222B